jgi:hypothetical protein
MVNWLAMGEPSLPERFPLRYFATPRLAIQNLAKLLAPPRLRLSGCALALRFKAFVALVGR